MKILRNGYLLLPAVFLLGACSEENQFVGDGENGAIRLHFDSDSSVVEARMSSRASTDSFGITTPEEGEFQVRLSKNDGTRTKTFSSIDEFRAETSFPIGDYTLEVFYGNEKSCGFEKPYFYGSEQVSVRPGETSNVSVTATLGNAIAEIVYTDEFRQSYPTASVKLSGGGEEFISYENGESRAGYICAGTVDIDLTMTDSSGNTVTVRPSSFKAEARHFYTVRIGVEPNPGGSGSLVLKVEFDDSVENETIDIDLTDELFTMEAPKVTPSGFADGETVNVVEGSVSNGVRMTVNAAGGIKNAVLSFESATFSPVFGNSVDLIGAGETLQSQLSALGIDCKGFFRNPERMAVVDLSKFTSVAPAGEHSVSLVVTDGLGRVSDPLTVRFSVEAVDIDASVPVAPEFEGNEVKVMVNGSHDVIRDGISFEVSDKNGILHPASIKKIEESTRGAVSYIYTVEIPVNQTTYVDVAVKYGDKVIKNLHVAKNMPGFKIEADAYSHKVVLKVSADNAAQLESIVRSLVFGFGGELVADSRIKRDLNTGIIEIDGLEAGKAYTLQAAIGSLESGIKTVTFTTESELEVPNGDFENVAKTFDYTINQGGQWTISAIGKGFQTTMSAVVNEPVGWASTNAKTMSSSTANTWFRIPSVYCSDITWSVHQPEAKIMGIGQSKYDETPEIYSSIPVKSGSRSLVVRNVGWDAAGTVPSITKQTGNTSYSNYHNSSTAPTLSNHSAGKTFLGSYSYSSGAETYKEGVSFTSRPASLKGFYQYSSISEDSGETGVVTVSVLSGTTVLATGSAKLSAISEFKEFEIPLVYNGNFGKKATELRIMITSSNHASADSAVETQTIKLEKHQNKQEQNFRGAQLVIDNLRFEY